MAIRRCELTDEEWNRIKDYIPTSTTGRPPKDHRQMLNAMMWLAKAVLCGMIYRNVMAHGKQYTAVFASGGTKMYWLRYSRR